MAPIKNDHNSKNKGKEEESSQVLPGSLKTQMEIEREEKESGKPFQPEPPEKSNNDDSVSPRNVAGKAMTSFSDFVNENLIAFRYGTVATVTLLTAYGLANTSLFFRYKNVREIPADLFLKRKRLRARVVKTVENDQAGQPLVVYARHISPAGSILNSSTYDLLMRTAPSAAATGKSWESQTNELFKVEIAGLTAPPFYISHGDQRGEWLDRFTRQKTMVKLQLLGRRIAESEASTSNRENKTKRDVSDVYPDIQSATEDSSTNNKGEEQTAVARIYYRPNMFQVFATDVADSLVRYGHACVNSEIFMKNEHTKGTKVVDASASVSDLRKDIRYLESLEKLEYEAAKKSYGMWSDSQIRKMRRDVIDEVEFQSKASIWQKLWRWLRG